MKKLIIISIVSLFFLAGCGSTQKVRESLTSWAESDVKNVEAMKTISKTLKGTWEFYSGVLDGFEDELSGETMALKKDLDELYASEKWDDRAAGKALTLRGKLVYEIGKQKLETLLPGFLKIFTLF